MDLRRRLLGRLSLLLGGLLAVALLVQLHSLRADIEAEISASARLVGVLQAAGEADDVALAERLAGAGLRHLSIRPADQGAEPDPAPTRTAWLGLLPTPSSEQQIRVGERNLIIAPKPDSEIDERLGDTVRLLTTLLLYSGATLLVAWYVADRALRPVRDLETGLHRLARGEPDPALPAFALREFARVAGAIDQLAANLRDARAAERQLARQLIAVQEDERRTLARELHDELGQTLTALNVTAAHLERNAGRLAPAAVAECASDLRRDIRRTGEQMRHMLKALRPHGLDAAGLADTLRELVDGWRSRETGIEFALELPSALPALDEAPALALYRVIQEALTNVVRHSGARWCSIRIASIDRELRAEIEDDGAGLPQAGPARRGGLLGMAERLDMVGGSLTLQGRTGGGLRLLARLPAAGVEASAVANEERGGGQQ